MKIKELIERLSDKDQEAEVEFIVAKPSGEIVTMSICKTARDIAKLLKVFKGD